MDRRQRSWRHCVSTEQIRCGASRPYQSQIHCLEAMRSTSVDDARNALKALDRAAYSPFTCLLVGHDSSTRLDWTGARLTHAKVAAADIIMLTSSSWQFDEVKAQREALFRRIWTNSGGADDGVAAFHSRRDSANDAWAPMMQRPQSQTKSVTQVELTSLGAEMRHWTRDAAIERQLTAPDESLRIPTPVRHDGRVQV